MENSQKIKKKKSKQGNVSWKYSNILPEGKINPVVKKNLFSGKIMSYFIFDQVPSVCTSKNNYFEIPHLKHVNGDFHGSLCLGNNRKSFSDALTLGKYMDKGNFFPLFPFPPVPFPFPLTPSKFRMWLPQMLILWNFLLYDWKVPERIRTLTNKMKFYYMYIQDSIYTTVMWVEKYIYIS